MTTLRPLHRFRAMGWPSRNIITNTTSYSSLSSSLSRGLFQRTPYARTPDGRDAFRITFSSWPTLVHDYTLRPFFDHVLPFHCSTSFVFAHVDGLPSASSEMSQGYFLRDHNTVGSEWDRLDEFHNGMRSFLKGGLSMAQIENPRRVLDIGAGSGAWAIQAAQMFPRAEVVAADIHPLPARSFPSNVTFQELDIINPGAVELESFDVVHIRLLLYHIPEKRIRAVLENTTQLLKPNGWLLIEEPGKHSGHEASKGPTMANFEKMYMAMLHSKGLDPVIGEHLEEHIQRLDSVSEINVHCVQLTLTTDQDRSGLTPEIRSLSNALRVTIERVATGTIGEDMESAGLTPEMQKAWAEERRDPGFHTIHDFWFICARRKGK